MKRKHASHALDGEGARVHGGRWNPPGTPMVYLAESQSLALLEVLVHLGSAELAHYYVSIRVVYADDLCETLPAESLPDGWRHSPPQADLQRIGFEWCRSGRSLLLAVPSAIVPAERVILLNPLHPDVSRFDVGEPEDFQLDPRLAGQG